MTSAFIYRVQIIQIQSAQLLLISKVLKQNIKNWRVAQDLCTALDMRFRRIDKRVSLNTGIFDSSKLVDNTVVNTLLSQLFQCFFFLASMKLFKNKNVYSVIYGFVYKS